MRDTVTEMLVNEQKLWNGYDEEIIEDFLSEKNLSYYEKLDFNCTANITSKPQTLTYYL